MTPWSPWVNDLRQQDLRGEMSRSGFPLPPSCRLRRYRSFTVRAAACTFALMCLFGLMTSFGESPSGREDLSVKQVPSARRLHLDGVQKRKGVIILTSHRSGSTFFGQLFNQRPDVFFMFEPLLPFGFGCDPIDDDLRVDYLSQLFECNIPDVTSLPTNKGSRKFSDIASMKKCAEENMCFREKTKRMCTAEFCQTAKQCWDCDPVDSHVASRMCRNSRLAAMKVIRFCDLVRLKPLFENPALEIKMLHLVRDPRGVWGSRQKLETTWGLEKMNVTCRKTEKAIDVAFDTRNTWLEGKYKIVRYEDVCQKPFEIAKEIYQFVGLPMTTEMQNWITLNTKGSLNLLGDTRAHKVAHMIRKGDKEATLKELRNAIVNDPYTTTRNSSATWKAWRRELNFRAVEQVQGACRTVMDKLRYIPTATEFQLHNDDFEVLKMFCSDKTLPRCSRIADILLSG